jgi:two-component system NtrC family sensor kinase
VALVRTDITSLKRAEQTLRESAQRLRSIIEAQPLPMIIVRLSDAEVRYASPATAEMYGYSLDRIVGEPATRLYSDEAALTRFVDALRRDGAVESMEVRTVHASGRTIWALISGRPIEYEGDDAVVVGIFDLSERKAAEEALAASAAQQKLILDNIPARVAFLDSERRYRMVNERFDEVGGFPSSEVIGKTVADTLDQGTFDELRPLAEAALRGVPGDWRGWVDYPAGRRYVVRVYTPNALPDGQVDGFFVFVQDFTEQKLAEDSVRAAEAQQRLILDNIPARVAFVDSERRHRYVNKRYLDLLERAVDDVIGHTVAETLGEETAAVLRPLSDRALQGEVVQWQGWITYPRGGERFVVRSYAPNILADGTIDGYFAFSQDFTEQKLAEQEVERQREALHQSEKMSALGSLLAGVAHELNNPLSVVVGQAMMMEEEAPDPKTATRAEKIRTAAERCARIVKTFLAMARQRQPERCAVQLNALVEGALELLGYGLRTADIEIDLDLAADLPETWADENLLGQVVTNLIVNAQQAMEGTESPRRLRLGTWFDADESALRIQVADSGPGIPADIRPRIFEPFFTTKPVGSGTGIGLSVCHGIVVSHDGSIEVTEGSDGGAAFVVTLPYQPPLVEAAPEPARERPAGARHSILVVDDEPDIAEILAELLGADGHRVDVAASGREAMERVRDRDYDLILSDLRMPDLDGQSLYRRLERERPQLLERVVFITGDTLGLGIGDFVEASGRPCIEKPFTPEDVRAAIDEVLAASATLQSGR